MALSPEEKQKIEEEERFRAEARQKHDKPKKKNIGTGAGCLVIIIFFVVGGAIISAISGGNKNTTTTQPTNTVSTILAQHKVIPGDIHGTTRQVIVIVQPNVTKQELIDLNDSLKSTYSSGLTHLTIEYFDDETIASDYFQKIVNVSNAQADKMFVHYRATYTLNQTSGFNKLDWNEPPTSASLPAGVDNNHWVNLKTY